MGMRLLHFKEPVPTYYLPNSKDVRWRGVCLTLDTILPQQGVQGKRRNTSIHIPCHTEHSTRTIHIPRHTEHSTRTIHIPRHTEHSTRTIHIPRHTEHSTRTMYLDTITNWYGHVVIVSLVGPVYLWVWSRILQYYPCKRG